MKLHIKGSRLIDPVNGIDAQQGLYITVSRVVGVGHTPADFHASRTTDTTGLVICPGLVDLPTRLRELGFEYKIMLESEIAAVMVGGMISLVRPPGIDPVLDEPGLVEMLKSHACDLNQVYVYPLDAPIVNLKSAVLTEVAELTESGCVGFSQTDTPMVDTQVLMRVLQYAQTFGLTVWLCPENLYLGKDSVATGGPLTSCLGLSGVSVIAETVCLHAVFELIHSTGVHIHLCYLSSAVGIEPVRRAKAEGLPATCDVNVHHIPLTNIDIGYSNLQMRFVLPLRFGRDHDGIVRALTDDTIDAIYSDHTPVDDDEKLLPSAEVMPGATGLEILLPLTLRWATEHKAGLSKMLACIIGEPTRVLGLHAGSLEAGVIADVCAFDPEAI